MQSNLKTEVRSTGPARGGAAVIVFPGSNCDRDVKVAVERVTGRPAHFVWHGDATLPEADLIVVPGGFSYGDYLRPGAVAAHSPIMRSVVAAAKQGRPVLGICNGFQILAEARLLPGALLRNAGLNFICRPVHLRVETTNSRFTSGYAPGQVLQLPVAHHDGNYSVDPDELARLQDEQRVAFRYCSPDGERRPEWNPNGSVDDIAGVLNEARNVLGLMPHPERASDPALGSVDGACVLQSALEAVAR